MRSELLGWDPRHHRCRLATDDETVPGVAALSLHSILPSRASNAGTTTEPPWTMPVILANARGRTTIRTRPSFGNESGTVHSWCSYARIRSRVWQLGWDGQEVGPAGGFMHHSLCVPARRLNRLPPMRVDEILVVEVAIPPHPRRVSSPKCVPRHPIEFVRRQLRPLAAALYSSGRFNAGCDCTCSNEHEIKPATFMKSEKPLPRTFNASRMRLQGLDHRRC